MSFSISRSRGGEILHTGNGRQACRVHGAKSAGGNRSEAAGRSDPPEVEAETRFQKWLVLPAAHFFYREGARFANMLSAATGATRRAGRK